MAVQVEQAVQAVHLESDAFLVCLNHALSTEKEEPQKISEYERIEIPIHIVPHIIIGKVCLESAVELPKILFQEEQDAYRRIHSLTHLDSVTKIHNGSVFTKNLCSQMLAVSGHSTTVVGGQIGAKQAAFARVATRKGRAYGGVV
ncbi:lys-63-specific deubiquitinase BRCC36 isoform X3 [Sigmodon hispidus]